MSSSGPSRILIGAVVAAMLLAVPHSSAQRNSAGRLDSSQTNAELQQAVALTRAGKFQEAIPRYLALQGQVSDFVINFNLALCYVGTSEYKKAADLLETVRRSGHDTPEVENLLAQSLIGEGKVDDAWAAIQRAAKMAPKDEKLYLYAADTYMDAGHYDLGLKVVDLGLKSLPKSARLYFEHGMFLSQMDRFDDARADFQRAQQLAPGSDVAYIAGAQEAMYAGNVADAARIAREGVEKGNTHFLLLTILGEALLSNGATPGQPDFNLAQQALESVASDHPNFASAQLSLGKLYLAANRTDDAIARLELARKLDPQNPAVYSNLATAYKKHGDADKAQNALDTLARINQQQVEKIGNAPGDRKAGYASPTTQPPPPNR